MIEISDFRWPVDEHGYTMEHRRGDPSRRGSTILDSFDYYEIVGRGGPAREYLPLIDHPGLWRRFGESCTSPDGVIAFAEQFGLLDKSAMLDNFLNTASLIRMIANKIDAGDRDLATALFNSHARPRCTISIVRDARSQRSEFKPTPTTLHSALLLQAGEAIMSNRRWRKCLNCDVWFAVGIGGHTLRRKFCEDKCRVAWGRHNKHPRNANA